VTADMFADGHDVITGVLKYRHVPATTWTEIPLTPLHNDSWTASFSVTELGDYEYVVEGWVDRFATWHKGLIAKAEAGQDMSPELLEGAELDDAPPDRTRATTSAPLRVTVDPVQARYSAWYEMFPRSCTTDATRPGTLRDAEARLPDIAEMGFDVIYLPPVHPICATHRKR